MKKKNPSQPEKTPIDEIDDEELDEVAGGKKATKKKAARSSGLPFSSTGTGNLTGDQIIKDGNEGKNQR